MDDLELTGGARIGMFHATKPLAKLSVNKNKLELNAGLIGNLCFRPSDIVSVEPGQFFTRMGIKIVHKVAGYPANVIFITTENTRNLIEFINLTGFLTNTEKLPEDVEERIDSFQTNGRFPIKTFPAISLLVIWNVLCLFQFTKFYNGVVEHGNFIGFQLALGIMLLVSVSTLTVKPVTEAILKPGRTVKDLGVSLYFIIALSAVMLIALTVAGNLIAK